MENFNIDKNLIDSLKSDNKNLRQIIDDLQKELLVIKFFFKGLKGFCLNVCFLFKERESRYKEENDLLIMTVHSTLSKDARTENEKEALKKLFLSRQQEKNENLIKEQNRMIETLKVKCLDYEKDLRNSVENMEGPDLDLNLLNFDK